MYIGKIKQPKGQYSMVGVILFGTTQKRIKHLG